MKKILISITLVLQCFYANAEYSAKFFIGNEESLIFKNNSPIVSPSLNCIFDADNMIFGLRNLSSAHTEGTAIGETTLVYNNNVIGRDTATENFPSGLSLGVSLGEDGYGFEYFEICADDFSIYPIIII